MHIKWGEVKKQPSFTECDNQGLKWGLVAPGRRPGLFVKTVICRVYTASLNTPQNGKIRCKSAYLIVKRLNMQQSWTIEDPANLLETRQIF